MKFCVMLLVGLALSGASLAVALAQKKEPAVGSGLPPAHELKSEIAGMGRALQDHGGVLPGFSISPSTVSGRMWMPTNSVGSESNRWTYLQQPRLFALGRGPNARTAPPPGVYESEPYKCIVVVPGPQWDDRCVVYGGDWTAPMPVHEPELRLVPRRK